MRSPASPCASSSSNLPSCSNLPAVWFGLVCAVWRTLPLTRLGSGSRRRDRAHLCRAEAGATSQDPHRRWRRVGRGGRGGAAGRATGADGGHAGASWSHLRGTRAFEKSGPALSAPSAPRRNGSRSALAWRARHAALRSQVYSAMLRQRWLQEQAPGQARARSLSLRGLAASCLR